MLQDNRARAAQGAANIAIVGATGAVGAELIGCLERRGFPVASLKLLASERSAGKRIGEHVVEAVSTDAFDGVDVAFFSAGASVSRAYAPIAAAQGALVVDNSSAFRMEPAVALVVPEVNGEALPDAAGGAIVANPNCTTAVSVMALGPLRALGRITRVIGSSYQAASGAGAAAMEELIASTAAHLAGEAYAPKVLPHPYAFNLFSHNAAVDAASGYNGEEAKVMDEHRKILGLPELRISFTCVRVPVLRAHSVSLSVEFDRAVSEHDARAILEQAPGVRVVDDRAANHFPMPIESSGRDEVLVGRIRADASDPDGKTLALFVSGDQLLRGAALNAVLIAERLWR
jgi:aspartate-semialdehyde dehydrogenase